jgi:hypothetical protein
MTFFVIQTFGSPKELSIISVFDLNELKNTHSTGAKEKAEIKMRIKCLKKEPILLIILL